MLLHLAVQQALLQIRDQLPRRRIDLTQVALVEHALRVERERRMCEAYIHPRAMSRRHSTRDMASMRACVWRTRLLEISVDEVVHLVARDRHDGDGKQRHASIVVGVGRR